MYLVTYVNINDDPVNSRFFETKEEAIGKAVELRNHEVSLGENTKYVYTTETNYSIYNCSIYDCSIYFGGEKSARVVVYEIPKKYIISIGFAAIYSDDAIDNCINTRMFTNESEAIEFILTMCRDRKKYIGCFDTYCEIYEIEEDMHKDYENFQSIDLSTVNTFDKAIDYCRHFMRFFEAGSYDENCGFLIWLPTYLWTEVI